MTTGPGRQLRGLLLLVGGIAGLAASPAAGRLRRVAATRLGRVPHVGDPVTPFRQAPCYDRDPDGSASSTRSAEAVQ
ncbi:MAG: hypothetical protein IT200_00105 [Thermoleophilia bacterium]|nr:hypothetical protein [Thermoleophilia bacterium]